MPYPMFKSTSNSRPVISRPLPLRPYQDQDQYHEISRWSMSEASECDDDDDDHEPYRSFSPARPSTVPPQPRLGGRLNRPNVPPALTRNFHTTPKRYADLGYQYDDSISSLMSATTTSSSSLSSSSSPSSPSSPFPSMTQTSASAPAHHTTFASADPSLHRWLATTIAHQRYTTSQRLASTSATSSAPCSSRERDLPLRRRSPPPPSKPNANKTKQTSRQRDDRSDSSYEYIDYLQQQPSSPLPPPSALSLCNLSGWSCVARRTARTP